MLYIDKSRDVSHKTENKKNRQNQLEIEQLKQKLHNSNTKSSKVDNYELARTMKNHRGGQKTEKKNTKHDSVGKSLRHCVSALPLTDEASSHTPRFEVYLTHTLVAKQSPSSVSRPSTSTLTKSRSDQHLTSQQPAIALKSNYGPSIGSSSNAAGNQKVIKTIAMTPEQNRSLSAVYKSQSKPDINGSKSSTQRQQPSVQTVVRPQPFRPPSSTKPSIIAANPTYDSLNRTRNKVSTKVPDDQLMYSSLPRKSVTSNLNGGNNGSQTQTKRIAAAAANPLYIDTGSSRKPKVPPLNIPNNYSQITASIDAVDDNLIKFSQTLARAATNSPPIKRRSSSLLSSPNPRINARFATKSTIDEIYTQKNRKDNYEKYKKVANEILKENLARKFGKDYPFTNLGAIRGSPLQSSSESLSSTSSATDQQRSISSIPPDDIPLDIPNQYSEAHEEGHSPEFFFPPKVSDPQFILSDKEAEDDTKILEGTVTSDGNHLEIVNNVHVSDDEEEEEEEDDNSGEYNLDNEQSSSSDNGGDIEEFTALNPIERINEELKTEDDMLSLPDHQHSQSFRIENTSVGSIVEVFVHADSLQRAKDALLIVPEQGILSKKSSEAQLRKKRNAIFDPHILLLDACLEPDYELVKILIPKISDVSRCTIDGITALHNAVCSADPKVVLFLIQSGANVNASDADGWTPLHCAACCNNRQISKLLVENGASLFAVTLSDFEIPSQKCNKTNQEDTLCEEYLFWEQENLGVVNGGIIYALFEYVPTNDDELPLVQNQILKVIDQNPPGEGGWFLAESISEMVSESKQGFVAAAYVSCYPLYSSKRQ